MSTARTRNEADTRAELIDPKLKAAGWSVVEQSFIRREVICPGIILTGGKRGPTVDSDYVLVYRGRKLAAVEAKREGLSYHRRGAAGEGLRNPAPVSTGLCHQWP